MIYHFEIVGILGGEFGILKKLHFIILSLMLAVLSWSNTCLRWSRYSHSVLEYIMMSSR